MIKLCKNLFYKPKYGSDADSIMLKRLFTTVTTILVCLAAISFSAYAFFSYSVTSGNNTIKSSSFSASVKIEKGQELVTQGDIQSHYFKTPGEYTVTMIADDEVTGTGFYMISVNGAKYYTQQLGTDLNAPGGKRTEISFTLDIKAAAIVNFESRWGTNSNYNASTTENKFYITNADPLQIIVVDAVQGVADNNGETQPEETEPEGTTESPSEETTENTTEDATESTTPDETVPTTDSGERVHIVQEGENLDSIAKKYGTTYSVLADYNDIDEPRVIQPGQELRIPPAEEETPEVTISPETTPETTVPTEQTEPAVTVPEENQSATETTGAPQQ